LGGTRAPPLFWLDTLLIRRALRQIKPDVLHAWGSEKGTGLVASRLKYPYLITIQGLLSWYKDVIPLANYDKFSVWVEKISLSRATHVSTESKFAVAHIQERHPRLSVHQIEHAPNWMFHQIQRQPATAPIRFLANGTLGYRKGTDLLLMALNELAPEFPFEVLIIGEPNEPFLAPLMAGLSPEFRDRIVFKSDVPATDIAHELSRATLLLLPTRADTSPNSVKEAVVAGVPVVASNVGGIPDYIIPGENGFLFTPGDKAEFVAMIRAAVAHPLFFRGLVTPSLLAKNRGYLSPARMAQLFLSVYHDVQKRE
jgi:glycosyltransferase involved in cell wall biosynthesis